MSKEKIPLDVAKELAPGTTTHSCGVVGDLQCGNTFIEGNRRYFDFIYLCSNCGTYFRANRKSL